MVCDSNNVIYAAEPEDTICRPFLEDQQAMIASVTRIEVLGFPGFSGLDHERQNRLHSFVASTTEAVLDEEIIVTIQHP